MTFREIASAANAAPFAVLEIVAGAMENADDTIRVEHRFDSPEWVVIAQASLEDILAAGGHDKNTVAWFTKRGVRF